MRRFGHRLTVPAPIQAPSTAAAIIATKVRNSTVTTAMKSIASVTVGSAWPTFIVPGIKSSGTSIQQFVNGTGDRERTDAKRVHEIRDESDIELLDPLAPLGFEENYPHIDIDQRHYA